jgi:hypothetical protein
MAKAQLLGDNGDLEGEDPFDLRRRQGGRVSLGGAAGRVPRLAPRATAGVAAAGLGGPQPTPSPGRPGGPGGRPPSDRGDVNLV